MPEATAHRDESRIPGHQRPARRLPVAVWILLVGTFLIHVGSYMVVPYLMVLLPQNLAVSTLTAAALVFVVKFSVQASSVIGGPLADRLGTRRMLVLGLLLRAAGMAAFALTRHVGCYSRPARWQAWAAGSMHPPPAEPSVP